MYATHTGLFLLQWILSAKMLNISDMRYWPLCYTVRSINYANLFLSSYLGIDTIHKTLLVSIFPHRPAILARWVHCSSWNVEVLSSFSVFHYRASLNTNTYAPSLPQTHRVHYEFRNWFFTEARVSCASKLLFDLKGPKRISELNVIVI